MGQVKRLALLLGLWVVSAYAQGPAGSFVIPVVTAPTGACSSVYLPWEATLGAGTFWYCNGSPGMWTQTTSGSSSSIAIGATVSGGNAQDMLFVGSTGLLAQEDNYQVLSTPTAFGQTGVAILGLEPDLSGLNGNSNAFSVVNSGPVYASLFSAGPNPMVNFNFILSGGTPSTPTQTPDNTNANNAAFFCSAATCNTTTGAGFIGVYSGYAYLAALGAFSTVQGTSTDGNHYSQLAVISPGAYSEFVFSEDSTSVGTSVISATEIEDNNGAPVASGGSLIQRDVGNLKDTGITASTLVSSTAGKVLESATVSSPLTFTGNALACPTCSTSSGGVPICPSNTASASSTAYTCSDGGSSTIAQGYTTIWQPGTNDTPNSSYAPTLAVDGAAPAVIVNIGATAKQALGFLTVGTIYAGVQFQVTWDGARWQVQQLQSIGPYTQSNTSSGYKAAYQVGTATNDTTCVGALTCGATVGIADETAVGYNALPQSGLTGAENTAVGSGALAVVTTGARNTGVGYNASPAVGYGADSDNTLIGANAGSGNAASQNTFIGSNANTNNNNSANCTAIGYNSNCNASNTVNLGNASVTAACVGCNTSGVGQATLSTAGVISQATKFTISGCSAGTTVGGATAGQFASGTTGTCTVVITMNGATGITAPNGWACSANDISIGVALPQTATSTTTCTISGATSSGNIVVFQAMAY